MVALSVKPFAEEFLRRHAVSLDDFEQAADAQVLAAFVLAVLGAIDLVFVGEEFRVRKPLLHSQFLDAFPELLEPGGTVPFSLLCHPIK